MGYSKANFYTIKKTALAFHDFLYLRIQLIFFNQLKHKIMVTLKFTQHINFYFFIDCKVNYLESLSRKLKKLLKKILYFQTDPFENILADKDKMIERLFIKISDS